MATIVEGPKNPMGTAAMVVGIIALVLALIPGICIVSLLLGPVAVVLGIVARKRAGLPPGGAKAGIITGVLAIVIAIAWLTYLTIAQRAANASTEVTASWLNGRWATVRGNCDPDAVLYLKADGSYTAPSTDPRRLAIGIWSVENRTLQMGTVFRQDRFTVQRLGYGEMTLQAGSAPPTPMYRC